jgi:hypothetical protein
MRKTCRLSEIDMAVQRRLNLTFFVGLPPANARKKLLLTHPTYHKHLSLRDNPQLTEELVAVTTNFSGAAMLHLMRNASERALRDHCYPLPRSMYRSLVQEAARKFNITLGGVTLATLLLPAGEVGPAVPPVRLSPSPEAAPAPAPAADAEPALGGGTSKANSGPSSAAAAAQGTVDTESTDTAEPVPTLAVEPTVRLPAGKEDMTALLFDLMAAGDGVNIPTGRVVVQLHDPPERRGWAVQLVPRKPADSQRDTPVQQSEAFVHFIPWPGLSKHETLRLLARFSSGERGLEGGIKSVQVVTGDSLIAAGVTDEAAAVKHVTGVLDTAAEYATSIVALDVSSVADGQEDETRTAGGGGGEGGGDTKSFRIGRWQAWRQMLDAFSDKTEYALTALQPCYSQNPERARYVILVSTDERLTDRLAASCKSVWTDGYVEAWREHLDEPMLCTRNGCGKHFSETDPNEQCKHHRDASLQMAPFDGGYIKLREILSSAYGIRGAADAFINDPWLSFFFLKEQGWPADVTAVFPGLAGQAAVSVDEFEEEAFKKDNTARTPAVYVSPAAEVPVDVVRDSRMAKYFPPRVYKLLCWKCCGRPYAPFDEPNGELVKPKHEADKVSVQFDDTGRETAITVVVITADRMGTRQQCVCCGEPH